MVSCRLSTTDIRFLVILFPPRNQALLTVSFPTPCGVGPRRGYRVPHTRDTTGKGALYTPGTTVPAPDWRSCPAGVCRISTTPSLHPGPASTCRSPRLTRHQRGFTQFTRPIFPSPAATRMERAAAWAFPRASHPTRPRAGQRTSGQGQATEHGPETTLYIIDPASKQRCSLMVCDLASHRSFRHSPPGRECPFRAIAFVTER